MSKRRQDEIDSLFQKATKTKIKIEGIPLIEKIVVVLDGTIQGKHSLYIATQLARRFEAKFNILVGNDFYNSFKEVVNRTQDQSSELKTTAQVFSDENKVESTVEVVMGKKITNMINLFNEEAKDEDKLSSQLLQKIKELEPDILVLGAPLFQDREDVDAENFGSYVTKILREKQITSNILLVSDKTTELRDSILGFVTVSQQPQSIVTLAKRAVSISLKSTKLKIIGLVDDTTVETVARVGQDESEEEVQLNLDDVQSKIKGKLKETLESLEFDIDRDVTLKTRVKTGKIPSLVSTTVEDENPGLVAVRSVADLAENLDPIAEQITRSSLAKGFPVLIVWN